MRRITALLLSAACTGGAASAPQQVSIPAPSSAVSTPICPERSVWNGQLCVHVADPACPQGTERGDGGACGARRAIGPDLWSPPAALPTDAIEARRLFARAVQSFSKGDYAAALADFEGAYARSAHDAVLVNIATTLEQLGRIGAALDIYTRYLANSSLVPSSTVQTQIVNLKQKLGRP